VQPDEHGDDAVQPMRHPTGLKHLMHGEAVADGDYQTLEARSKAFLAIPHAAL
jgi:hypothetical protein